MLSDRVGSMPTNDRGYRNTKVNRFQKDELRYQKLISRGGMGEISLYKLQTDKTGYPTNVAVKTLIGRTISDRDMARLRMEMTILSELQHSNVIRTYGVVETDSGLGVVLQYFPYGSYAEFFGNLLDKRPEIRSYNFQQRVAPLKIRLLDEITDALKYLHGLRPKEVLHLDLKSENVLLGDKLQAKICDFGLSRISTLTTLRASVTVENGYLSGTPGFIPPERLRDLGSKPTSKCDVYAFAILAYTILTDCQPYPDINVKDYELLEYHVATKNKRPDIENIPVCFPTDITRIIEVCWSSRPDDRPSFKKLKNDMAVIKDTFTNFESQAAEATETILRIHEQIITSSRFRSASEKEYFECIESEITQNCRPNIMTEDPPSSARTGNIEFSNLSGILDSYTHPKQHGTITSQGSYSINSPKASSRNIARSLTGEEHNQSAEEDNDDDDEPLILPGDTMDTEHQFCSMTKIILVVGGGIIFSAAIVILLAVFVLPNTSKDSTCPPLGPPNHGRIECKNATRQSNEKCQFICDDGYGIIGSISTTCIAGKWTNREPTCLKQCKELPEIQNCDFACSNGRFQNSTCSFTCENSHILHGSNKTSCLMDGNWSNPEPTCICPKCSVGNTCQYSISWSTVEHALDSITPYQTITINYGGNVIACSVHLHSIVTWSGSCSDSSTGDNVKCTGYKSPSSSANHAAAELIRQLLAKKESYPPCDPSLLPTGC